MSAMFPLQRTVPSGQNSLVLQPLQANSGYKISITPIYPEGDGPTASQMGRTRKSGRQVGALGLVSSGE